MQFPLMLGRTKILQRLWFKTFYLTIENLRLIQKVEDHAAVVSFRVVADMVVKPGVKGIISCYGCV
jgi:hypothetical protein